MTDVLRHSSKKKILSGTNEVDSKKGYFGSFKKKVGNCIRTGMGGRSYRD